MGAILKSFLRLPQAFAKTLAGRIAQSVRLAPGHNAFKWACVFNDNGLSDLFLEKARALAFEAEFSEEMFAREIARASVKEIVEMFPDNSKIVFLGLSDIIRGFVMARPVLSHRPTPGDTVRCVD